MDANAHLRCIPTAADGQALLRGRWIAHLTRPRAKKAPSANRALPVSLTYCAACLRALSSTGSSAYVSGLETDSFGLRRARPHAPCDLFGNHFLFVVPKTATRTAAGPKQ